jgi:hypothetical protein
MLILLDTGEAQPTEYHIVFDVKYNLMHDARLVVGGN